MGAGGRYGAVVVPVSVMRAVVGMSVVIVRVVVRGGGVTVGVGLVSDGLVAVMFVRGGRGVRLDMRLVPVIRDGFRRVAGRVLVVRLVLVAHGDLSPCRCARSSGAKRV